MASTMSLKINPSSPLQPFFGCGERCVKAFNLFVRVDVHGSVT